MELVLESERQQGAHEVGGRALGGKARPTCVERWWAPWKPYNPNSNSIYSYLWRKM